MHAVQHAIEHTQGWVILAGSRGCSSALSAIGWMDWLPAHAGCCTTMQLGIDPHGSLQDLFWPQAQPMLCQHTADDAWDCQ